MSKRQVIILWSIAAILGLAVLVIKLCQDDPDQVATERKPGETLFESFPAEQIAEVVIQGAKQSVTLQKSGDDWVLKERDNYPANTAAVLEMIRTIHDLEITRAIEAGPSLAPRFGMDVESTVEEERGLEIRFMDKDKQEIACVTLGKNIEANSGGGMLGGGMTVGRYIRNHADESGFYASNEMFPSIGVEANLWLRDTFISPEKIESISVTVADSDEIDWHLKRESEEAVFQVVGGKPNEVANAQLANRLGSLFSYARFDDVVPAADVAKRSAEKGKRKAVIKTFEGFTYTVTLTPSADNAETYLLQVSVDATLPAERKKAEGESAEDAEKLDKAFNQRRQQLQDKLNEAKFFEGRTYQMGKSSVDLLLYGRGDMVNSVQPKPAEAGDQPPAMLTPGGNAPR